MDTERSFPVWKVHGDRLFSAEVSQLVEQRTRLVLLLRERLTISKHAASFLKSATQTQDIGALSIQQPVPIESIERFHLTLKDDDTGDDPIPSHTITNKWVANFWALPSKMTEPEVFGKEVLKITADVKVFLRECFYMNPITEKPEKLEFETQSTKYYINFEEREVENVEDSTYVSIPRAAPIIRKNDKDYLDEVLDSISEFTGDMSVQETPLSRLSKKSDFHIPLTEKLTESIEQSQQVVSERWEPKINTCNDAHNWKSLERYVLEEELEKGVEYRLRSLFMDDRPTFEEPTSVWDRIDVPQRFPLYQMTDFASPKFSDFTNNIDERALLSEDILPESAMMPLFVADVPEKLEEGDPYLIHGIIAECDLGFHSSMRKQLATASTYIDTHKDSVESPNITLLQNSNIQVKPITESATTANLAESSKVDTTLNATKMFTTDVEISDKSITKRSIDDDLNAIIQTKRKRLFDSQEKKKEPKHKLIDLLLSNATNTRNLENDLEGLTSKPESAIESAIEPKSIKSFPEAQSCENLIVFNSSLTANQLDNKILKHLDKTTNLSIAEADLGETDVDFILSPTDGLLVLPFKKCQQTSVNGDLLVQDTIIQNMVKYKRLHVLIVSDILDKHEDLLYTQICLSITGIEVIITDQNMDNICGWIRELSAQFGRAIGGLNLDEISVCKTKICLVQNILTKTAYSEFSCTMRNQYSSCS